MTAHSLRYASLLLLVQIHGEPAEQAVSGRPFLISSLYHQDRNCSWKIKFSRFRWKGCNFSRIECVFLLGQRARIRRGVEIVRLVERTQHFYQKAARYFLL